MCYTQAGSPAGIDARWTVRFTKGGPVPPPRQILEKLRSWTELPDPDSRALLGHGTLHRDVPRPDAQGAAWALISERYTNRTGRSAREALGTSIGSPHRFIVPDAMLRSSNALRSLDRVTDPQTASPIWIGVACHGRSSTTWLSAAPAREPRADGLFSAARWTPLESRLIWPVTLTPLTPVK